jgi:F-type H+-transporting ATPase subunit b
MISGIRNTGSARKALGQTLGALLGLALTALPAAAAETAEPGGASPFAGDVGTALWTVVIFGVVLVILGKYAWGPILQGLQDRERFVRESLEAANAKREEAEARLQEYLDKLNGAKAEAQALLDEGRRDAEATRRRIVDEAREESEKIAARSRREIQIATETALKDLYSTSARLATDIAARVIGRELTPADHRRLIAESIEELGNAGGPGAPRAH